MTLSSQMITNFRSKMTTGKKVLLIGIALFLIGAVIAGNQILAKSKESTTVQPAFTSLGPNTTPVPSPQALAKEDVNYEFSFGVSPTSKTSDITYTIESAELADEIIIKGQRARSVSGRLFLLLNLKITNKTNQGIEINSKNFIRVARKSNTEEWIAPDIHNDPVSVQAISTKYTRVGFPVNSDDREFVLRVGEIDGDKKDIELIFQ